MNVTVDSLRNLAANQSIMFNAKSESIEKAKAYHSIGVHFGTAASKARNQATLQAIKQAIVSNEAGEPDAYDRSQRNAVRKRDIHAPRKQRSTSGVTFSDFQRQEV